ncbi:MAG: SufD family Fe-S cluster assembly protein [Synechococcaceae cyanobacterium]
MVAAPAAAAMAPGSGAASLAWLAKLAGAPLPTRRQEDWRFTDLSPLEAIPAGIADADPGLIAEPWAGLSLPAGVTRLAAAAAEPRLGTALAASGCHQHWPVLLNAGASPALLALKVEGDAGSLELPLPAPAADGLVAWRLLLVLEPGARLELLLAPAPASGRRQLLSLVSEAVLGEGACLQLGCLALGQEHSALLHHLAVRQAAGSELQATVVSSGWALARHEPRIVQEHGAARTRLLALQRVDGRELADTHSFVRFDGPDGELDQLHKAVADGAGRSVFNGAVQVPRAAQRTNAAQLSRNLLLSDRARIDTKPELEIVADDVKCAHGATVSQLQTEELFYLRSRGIDSATAARLLERAFCHEVLQELPAGARGRDPIAALLGDA